MGRPITGLALKQAIHVVESAPATVKYAVSKHDAAKIKKDLEEVVAIIRPEVEQQKNKMIDSAARAFATRLSEAELKEIAAFYRTPAGKKYVEVQPGLLDDIVKDLATWAQNVSEYVLIRARAEMSKRGHQLQ